jgi:hypothetical protein
MPKTRRYKRRGGQGYGMDLQGYGQDYGMDQGYGMNNGMPMNGLPMNGRFRGRSGGQGYGMGMNNGMVQQPSFWDTLTGRRPNQNYGYGGKLRRRTRKTRRSRK